MTGANIASISGGESVVEVLEKLDFTRLDTSDIELIRELRRLVNAGSMNLSLQKELALAQAQTSPASYGPPPGDGHPGINVTYPVQPPALPAAPVQPNRRRFTLAEVVRYAAATGGITGAVCSILLIPLEPILGPHDSMLAPAVITTIFGLVLFAATVVIVRSEDTKRNR